VTRALRAAHSGFYLSAKTISVGLIGPGTVGGTLLDQIGQQDERLKRDFNLDLRVRAIARSSTMLLADRRVDLNGWRQSMADATDALDYDAFEAHVNPEHLPHAAIIDCTADEGVASRYAGWLSRGIHVITPNKKAFSGDQSYYDEIRDAARQGNSHYFYETTVGAALPIIKTLRDLIDTGDRIHSVHGILSGTLAYLFNIYDGTVPFSEIVREARSSGYTEPDPRDDLSGMDVARKLTILAREIGQSLGIGDFPVENLVPEALRKASIDEFLEGLPAYDDEMLLRYQDAQREHKTLRYVARLSADGAASVGLEMVDIKHAFSSIDLADNIVRFVTDRYAANPLVIQGPGAGPAVTAGGVFGDLLRLATFLGDGTQL
jgi:aspartokinase/homoserine dehydrogenase 1